MEPQLQHPQVHRYGEDHHHQRITNLEREAPHEEKKSVLEKVKVKAKKIKETIKKHGHLHDKEEEEKEDEYEEDHDDAASKSQLATNPVEGNQRLDHILRRSDIDEQTTSSKDHTGLGVPHGLGDIGRLIIPEEAPAVAPTNTPISQHQHGQEVAPRNAPISHAGDQNAPADHREALMQQKQSSYATKITSVLADKAIGAKNAVASKLGGAQSTNWAGKLKPGDEDKALSELISATLYNKAGTIKPEAVKDEGKRQASDTVHKRASEHDDGCHEDKEVKPMGRVTESEEVARRLGTSEEERRGEVIHVPTASERPIMDMIKETVGSWWSAGNQHEDSSQSEGKRLQESAN